MDTSTPVTYRRQPAAFSMSDSSMEQGSDCSNMTGMSTTGEDIVKRTNDLTPDAIDLVNKTSGMNITPPKMEKKLLQLVRQTIAATEYFNSVEFRKKTCMKRTRTTSETHAFIEDMEVDSINQKNNSVSHLLDSINWSNWEGDLMWKRYDSDTSLTKYQIINGTIMTHHSEVKDKALDEMYYAPDLEEVFSKEKNDLDEMFYASDQEAKKYVEKNCLDEMYYAPDLEDLLFINLDTEGPQVVHFQEEDIDEVEFNRELMERQKNKLYSIFNRDKAVLTTPVSFSVSGTKRKISPGAPSPLNNCPRTSLKQGRVRKLSFGDAAIPAQSRDRSNSTTGVVLQRKKKILRRQSNSVKNEQDLLKSQRSIKDMLLRKIENQHDGENMPDFVAQDDGRIPDLN